MGKVTGGSCFWDKAIEMKESGSTRKPGMSVEGKALERDKRNQKSNKSSYYKHSVDYDTC